MIDLDEATWEQWTQALEHAHKVTDAERQEVLSIGGIHIIGTERHNSRRLNDQLRGRVQSGDPGSSRFYLSLDDGLMRVFGGQRIKSLMLRLGMEEGVPVESKLVSRRIENAQKKVEAQSFALLKRNLEYDAVINKQREAIYTIRRRWLMGFAGDTPEAGGLNQRTYILGLAESLFDRLVARCLPKKRAPHEWDLAGFKEQMGLIFGFDVDQEQIGPEELSSGQAQDALWQRLETKYAEKEEQIGVEAIRNLERYITINIIDTQWKDQLAALTRLKDISKLRDDQQKNFLARSMRSLRLNILVMKDQLLAVARLKDRLELSDYQQRDLIDKYVSNTQMLFDAMLDRINEETVRYMFSIQAQANSPTNQLLLERRRRGRVAATNADDEAFADGEDEYKELVRPQVPRTGRNDPCPCGSGKKYRKCCGAT
jgi:preprotein translocase subunit SecA